MKLTLTLLTALLLAPPASLHAAELKTSESKRIDIGEGVTLEVVYLPPGEFMMGSTPEEKKWATGIEGGAQPGTTRESFEGEQPRLTRVKHGCWTMIYTYADRKATLYCKLPSGGDCSYAEAVEVGDEMLVSYYSSHEGRTSVYLARVPLKLK
jgi:hypothetical protein